MTTQALPNTWSRASCPIVETRALGDGRHRIVIAVNEVSRNPFVHLKIDGVEFTNYLKNPVVLWSHDDASFMRGGTGSAGLPIGRTLAIGLNAAGHIEVDFEFLPDDPFAARVENAWEKGFVRAASIRWIPLEVQGQADGSELHVRSDMLEWSLVAIPADPDTVRIARSLGLGEIVVPELEPEPEPEPVADPDPEPTADPEPTNDDPIPDLTRRLGAIEEVLGVTRTEDETLPPELGDAINELAARVAEMREAQ